MVDWQEGGYGKEVPPLPASWIHTRGKGAFKFLNIDAFTNKLKFEFCTFYTDERHFNTVAARAIPPNPNLYIPHNTKMQTKLIAALGGTWQTYWL